MAVTSSIAAITVYQLLYISDSVFSKKPTTATGTASMAASSSSFVAYVTATGPDFFFM